MADIIYSPQFSHTNWRDKQDRVIADGPNGFNLRFNTIAAEFQTLSQVVAQIATALDALGQQPPSGPITLTLTPNLMHVPSPISGETYGSWEHTPSVVQKPSFQTKIAGMMSVGLSASGPVRIQSFRVTGINPTNTSLFIALQRQSIEGTHPSDTLAIIEGRGDPFDLNVPVRTEFGTIDPAQFRCWITAVVHNSQPQASVYLYSFQITYQPL